MKFRQGKTVKMNVYEEDTPLCQCHNAADAERIVTALNHVDFSRHGDFMRNVVSERQRQDYEWGGSDHDDEHHERDWVAFIVKQLGKAQTGDVEFRRSMCKVAALALAGYESSCRKAIDYPKASFR